MLVSNATPIRVGVIGTGRHAAEQLLPAVCMHELFSVVGVSSRSLEKAKRVARQYRLPLATGDWQQLITRPEVDAVIVSATPEFHAEVIEFAIKQGVHIFVEKPPTVDSFSLKRLVRLEELTSTVVMVDFNFRFGSAVSEVFAIMDGTTTLRHAKISFVSSKPRGILWNCHNVLESVLLSVGIHAIEMATSLFGSPQEAQATTTAVNADAVSVGCHLKFDHGKSVFLQLGNYSNRFDYRLEFAWDSGAVVVIEDHRIIMAHGAEFGHAFSLGAKSQTTKVVPASATGYMVCGYSQALTEFASAIQENRRSTCSLKDCVSVYSVIDTILEAAKSE
jgi:predicted dehydrogenase